MDTLLAAAGSKRGGGSPGVPEDGLEVMYFELGGVVFGVDTEFTSRILTLAEAEASGLRLCWLHDLLSFGSEAPLYRTPRVLVPAGAEGRAGLVIEDPVDLRRVGSGDIRPLPEGLGRVLEPVGSLWGACLFGEGVMLFLDALRLVSTKR